MPKHTLGNDPSRHRRLMCEGLEPRIVLSGTPADPGACRGESTEQQATAAAYIASDVPLALPVRAAVDPNAAASEEGTQAVVIFDEALGERPEGITVGRDGTIYVSLTFQGEIRKIKPGTNEAVPFGAIDGFEGSALLGLTVDALGHVYAGVAAETTDEFAGVWRFHRWTGEATRVPGTEVIPVANSLTFDYRGNLYASDSANGQIWRIGHRGVEVWAAGQELEGVQAIPTGINGLAYRQGQIYGVNTDQQSIISVPVERGGDAGEVDVLGNLPALHIPDGIAFDAEGRLYATTVVQDAIVRINDLDDVEGSLEVLAGGGFWGAPQEDDPIDMPTNLAFGRRGDRDTIFWVNFSHSEQFGSGPKSFPGVASLEVDAVGARIPGGGWQWILWNLLNRADRRDAGVFDDPSGGDALDQERARSRAKRSSHVGRGGGSRAAHDHGLLDYLDSVQIGAAAGRKLRSGKDSFLSPALSTDRSKLASGGDTKIRI